MNTVEMISQLRKNGYKVRVAHLRKPPSINIPPVIEEMFLKGMPEYENILEDIKARKLFSTRTLRALDISPEPRGGVTRVEIIPPDELVSYVGETIVSKKDNYNKKYGLDKAFGRAYQTMIQDTARNFDILSIEVPVN